MVSQLMVMVVVVKCIKEEWNQYWSCSQTCTPKMNKSRYVIVGSLQVLPTQLLTTCLLATALRKKYAMLS